MPPTLNLVFCSVIVHQQMKWPRNNLGCLSGYREVYAEDPSWSHLLRYGCFCHVQEQNMQACECGWELRSARFWSHALCLPTYYHWGVEVLGLAGTNHNRRCSGWCTTCKISSLLPNSSPLDYCVIHSLSFLSILSQLHLSVPDTFPTTVPI